MKTGDLIIFSKIKLNATDYRQFYLNKVGYIQSVDQIFNIVAIYYPNINKTFKIHNSWLDKKECTSFEIISSS